MFVTPEQYTAFKEQYHRYEAIGFPFLDPEMVDMVKSLSEIDGLVMLICWDDCHYKTHLVLNQSRLANWNITMVVRDFEALSFVHDLYQYVFECAPNVSLTMERELWPIDCPIEHDDDYYPTITLRIKYDADTPERADTVKNERIDLIQTAIDDIVSDKIYFANKAKGQV